MKLLFRAGGLLYVHKGSPLIQMLLVMKMTLLLLTVACLQISARTNGQTITLSEKDAPLETIFKKIERQSGYHFFYRYEWLKDTKRVSIDVKNISLTAALDICFKNQPVSYIIVEKNIAVKLKQNAAINNNEPAAITDVKGKITTEQGEPIAGATITVKGTNKAVTTNEAGEFVLTGIDNHATLVISSVSFESREIKLNGKPDIAIKLKAKDRRLDSVIISYNTGYQYIPRERATGSFTHIDNELLNRSVSTNIIDRLKGVASGVLFDGNTGTSTGFSVRGRSTIFANTDPLIVLDNFPYDGDLSTINPNDVESITILKDAAAASIWGARASNGVVVITTKKGKFNQPIQVSFNSNVTIGQKPDLHARPDMTTSDIIDVERFLYDKGQYAGYVWTPYVAPSSVVAILEKQTQGIITEAEANTQLNALRSLNNKDDLLKYYYHPSVNQQYSLNVNGGGEFNKYYLSVGYDRNLQNVKTNTSDRLTINAANTYTLLNNRLEINAGINFSVSKTKSNGTGTYVNRPYEMLADAAGNPLNFNFYREEWTDTIGDGHLLDWKLKPLNELRTADNKSELTNYMLNVGVKYKIIKGLDANILYQYSKGITENTFFNPLSSFTARNQINTFSQVDYTTGNIKRGIPLGDMLSLSSITYQSHNVRGQLAYSSSWGKHSISGIAGAELKDYSAATNTHTLYGYNKETGQVSPVDFATPQPQIFYSWATGSVGGSPTQSGIADRYLSLYGNLAYTYNEKYTFSASARKDESNLFGVKANQKGVPLWSLGGIWNISKENFYKLKWLPDLSVRVTNGYNGNVDKSVSAFTTLQLTYGTNIFNLPEAAIVNPPNPSLRWEKVNVLNVGVDYGVLNGRIAGSIEYYKKNGKDLIGFSPLAPQTGLSQFRGNAADLKGEGFDVVINSINTKGSFIWNSTFLFSYNIDKITSYKVNTSALSFHEGYPYSAIFSYRWAGLDNIGDPLGYIGKETSKAWGTIINMDSIGVNTTFSDRGVPSYFGSLRNTFSWNRLSISVNLLYKMGYSFRKPSISYPNLFTTLSGHSDYQYRWQLSGDEMKTNIPSMDYPVDYNRDFFYNNSEVLVKKGSHVRFQDINISYSLTGKSISKLPVKSLSLYVYANNLGILWRANKEDIDPEYQDIPAQKNITIGLKADF